VPSPPSVDGGGVGTCTRTPSAWGNLTKLKRLGSYLGVILSVCSLRKGYFELLELNILVLWHNLGASSHRKSWYMTFHPRTGLNGYTNKYVIIYIHTCIQYIYLPLTDYTHMKCLHCICWSPFWLLVILYVPIIMRIMLFMVAYMILYSYE